MSGLAELARRQARLAEISGLMKAMKSLAIVENHKLARFIGHQRHMRANIEAAAGDFLQFHPRFGAMPAGPHAEVVLVVGAERGFCGGFDEHLVQRLDAGGAALRDAALVVVGSRLAGRLAGRPRLVARVAGATGAEDVPGVLDRVLGALQAWRANAPAAAATLLCLAHDAEGEPGLTQLLPMQCPATLPPRSEPPLLHLPPARFHAALLDQFLLAALFGHLYASLAAENRQRLAHMEQALSRLDATQQRLALRRNALRQERIIEEIEVMLASAQAAAWRGEDRGASFISGASP